MVNRLAILLLILSANIAFGQSNVPVMKRASRLVKVMNDHHFQPQELNDDFAIRIHESLLRSLDEHKSFFTREDIELLKDKAIEIDSDISNQEREYLNLLNDLWTKNVEKIKAIKNAFFDGDVDLESSPNVPAEMTESYSSDSEFETRWKTIFRFSVLNETFEEMEGKELPEADSLKSLIDHSKEQTSIVYNDYFANMTDLDFVNNLFLNAIAWTFDPHSNYFTYSENRKFEEELSSERAIFGISYVKTIDGKIKISAVHPGSAAWLSGEVHVGDIIQKIKFGNHKTINLVGKTAIQLGEMFDENYSDEITLTLLNESGNVREVELVRTKVYSDSDVIKSALLDGERKIGYISLPDFYTNWTDQSGLGCANDLAKTLVKLKKENIEGVILDLRDNGGGSLKEAIDLTGIFIDYGPVLVVKDTAQKPYTLKDFNRGSIYNGPLIVMINEGSASASEVVAGAIQDYNRGIVVGRRSFGKATGQGVFPVAPEYLLEGSDQANDWGFVSITELGLYRIDLTTNQVNGVQPSVVLNAPLGEGAFREKDYHEVLDLPAIEKKMYYTPRSTIDTGSLSKLSLDRQMGDSSQQLIMQLALEYDDLYKKVDKYNLTLSNMLTLKNSETEIENKIIEAYKNVSIAYEPKSAQYDDEVYRMNEYLNEYKESFLQQIRTDDELSETYNILMDYLELNK